MDAEELKKRTKEFALRILKLVAALPDNIARQRRLGGQLVRAGTSVGCKLSSCLSRKIESRVHSKDWHC